ncbi:Protein kinase-like domain [Pseudocohnilembus persalinus]|uniref:Protein kinase-like domain n=1 Tax=Pseudocohnilembus persalinus TaxID=266149 RepID=A0A0V0QKJ7_PSEPJ|nr:Protein kinase-like domain [Pseudocohnilembus persalinus]|eukprot:KRX02549.1 Protein kinase-like domain [Pseudocohnilembus persalinus]
MEYARIMGGKDSDMYRYFKNCIFRGFIELKKNVESIIYLVKIMSEESELPCFVNFNIQEFRARFMENSTDSEYLALVDKLVDQSYDNWRTNQYDKFQNISNGIMI